MKGKVLFFALLLSLLSLGGCGIDNDTAIITYIVSVTQGHVGKIIYLDDKGEGSTSGAEGKSIWTHTFKVNSGEFLFISAEGTAAGKANTLTVRIISNGKEIANGSIAGEDASSDSGGNGGEEAKRPIVSVEAYAVSLPEDQAQ